MPLTPETWLADFIVNLTTIGGANRPSIIQLTNGNIVVSWDTDATNPQGDGVGRSILAQIFDPLGNPIGTEFQLNNASTAGDETDAEIVALDSGGFVVVYEDNDGTPSIGLEEFSSTGTLVSSNPIVIDTAVIDYRNPQVASSSGTSVLIAYDRENNATGDYELYAKIYDPTTNLYSSEILLLNGRNFTRMDVDALTGGNYVIAGTTFEDGTDERVVIRIIDSTGANVLGFTSISHTTSTSTTETQVTVAGLTGGGFVVAYTESDGFDYDVYAQRFDATGAELGGRIGVDVGVFSEHNEPDVVALADGGFIVFIDDDDVLEMVGYRYNSSGVQVGGRFVFEASGGNSIEAVLLGDGRVAITWDDGDVRMAIIDTRDVPDDGGYTPTNFEIGTIGNDVFTTNVAGTTYGYDGNDIVTDGSGVQDIYGGDGDDTIIVANTTSTENYFGDAGTDTFEYTGTAAVTIDLAVETATAAGGTSTVVGFERAIGGSGNDTITGSNGINDLFGGDGNDSLYGGAAVDFLYGGAGDDTLNGGNTFNDQLFGGTGEDRLETVGAALLYGGDDNDTFTVLNGNVISSLTSTAYGGSGVDTFDASNELTLGFIMDETTAQITRGPTVGAFNTINVASIENVIGTDQGDIITGFENVTAGDGNDTITRTANSVLIDAGDGDDMIHSDNVDVAATISGGNGIDTLDLSSTTSVGWNMNSSVFSLTSNGAVLFTSGIEIFIGSDFNDTFYDNSTTNVLSGGLGIDITYADSIASTDDFFDGGAGEFDRLYLYNINTNQTFNMETGVLSGHGAATGFEFVSMGGGDDSVTGTSGNDAIYGGTGDDALDGGSDGFDTLYGGLGNDTLTSNNGGGYFYGGDDDDLLVSSLGPESMYGGTGVDTIDLTDGDVGYTFDMATGLTQYSGQLFQGFEHVITSSGHDTITGTSTADTIVTNGGNDVVVSGGDNDVINGGGGNDLINAGGGNDSVIGGSGKDDLIGGGGNDTIDGGADNDTVRGGVGADSMSGGTGLDTLSYTSDTAGVTINLTANTASGGNATGDTIASFESVKGGSGDNILIGTISANAIISRGGNDSLYGLDGDDRIAGGGGDDLIRGDGGADTLNGGGGTDTLSYGTGTTGVNVDIGLNTATGGDATGDIISRFENLTGGTGDDILKGTGGDNVIKGGAGNDRLSGRTGADELIGGAGTDTLNGGEGNDILTGGGAADVFIFNGPGGDDTITDFQVGIDTLKVYGLVEADLSFSNAGGGDTLITLSTGDTILVENTSIAQLNTFSDFGFV